MTSDQEILMLEEAADFLRLSRSTLYQRRDIPRHRLPGSRQIRYLRSELLAWLKGEQVQASAVQAMIENSANHEREKQMVDIGNGRVYHRNIRYR